VVQRSRRARGMAVFTVARLVAGRVHVSPPGATARRPLRRGRVGPPTAAADPESSEVVQPTRVNLAKVFQGEQFIFDTRSNMRTYSWNKEECLQVVKDLAESMARHNHTHLRQLAHKPLVPARATT